MGYGDVGNAFSELPSGAWQNGSSSKNRRSAVAWASVQGHDGKSEVVKLLIESNVFHVRHTSSEDVVSLNLYVNRSV